MRNEKISYMRLAIKEAQKNFKTMAGGPFGACIIKGKRVLAVARNTVLKKDATAHAEINAIRAASRKLKSFNLSGCVIYSTTEPCPMCFAAIHWSGISQVVYGTTILEAKRIGFNELTISAAKLKKIGKLKIKLTKSVLANECRKLFESWAALPNKKFY
jgi:tRNA(Arg) A34 adenosine deaminase TadA